MESVIFFNSEANYYVDQCIPFNYEDMVVIKDFDT